MAAASVLRFDLRRAPFSTVTEADQYAQCLEMSGWADDHGFGAVTVSEHHGVDFIAAPLTLAAMILARTRHSFVMVNALLLPLHDPVRVAEQVATLDLASGGRFAFVAGLGYKVEEFEMAGVDRSRRGALMDEYVDVILRAWTGKPFEWRDRTIVVTPTPASPARHLMIMGGSVQASAERAARFGLSFSTMSVNPAVGELYRAACEQTGHTDGVFTAPNGPLFVHVAEDPERAWAAIGPYALYDMQSYSSWQTGDHDNVAAMAPTSVDDLKASGLWEIVTPDECVALAKRNGSVVLHPLMGGIPPELGWESLQLFADRVQPRL
jgi:alkanesulfonate monooxygenase SsuD/methylene tetrahydromethanopterin reductase-like flavin-dependent oxidoreductase (luciferase family)